MGFSLGLVQVPDDGSSGDFQHPNENLRRAQIIYLCFSFVLPTVTVGLRIAARKINATRLYLDDYLIIIGLCCHYGCQLTGVMVLFNGLGSHVTMVPTKNLVVYLQIIWSNTLVYIPSIVFTKLSILCLYKRLFANKNLHRMANVVAVFVLLWGLIICLVGIFLCFPVRKFWDSTVEGTCLDAAKFYYGQQIPNILMDAIILVMPMKMVWDLQIALSQKLLLLGVFLLGGLTLIFDIFRLVAMIEFAHAGPDVTYNTLPVSMWTCLEAAVGITAANLPNLRPLLIFAHERLTTLYGSYTGKEYFTNSKSEYTSRSDGLSDEDRESPFVPYYRQNSIVHVQHSVVIEHSEE